MATQDTDATETEPKKGKKGLLIGLLLAVLLGGGGFFATYSGLILGQDDHSEETLTESEPQPAVSFVAINPMTVSLGRNSQNLLRFSAQLEVDPKRAEDVSMLMPRILDVLNGYLRAVDLAELKDPAALIRLRAQMLRRIQLVTGAGHVRDLLITEFVFT